MKKILVIGANGFVGRRILDNLSENGACEVFGCSLHPDIRPGGNHTSVRLDINDYPAVEALFDHICPDVVVNCSALSVPDYCEQHREEAYAINVSAVENLAYCCEHQGSRLIHLSTDFVFDGRSDRLYTEEDLPAPLNYYGVTKYQGEQAVASICRNYAIVRVARHIGIYASGTGREPYPPDSPPTRFIYLNYSNRTLSGTVQMRFNLLKPETILYLCPVLRIKRI